LIDEIREGPARVDTHADRAKAHLVSSLQFEMFSQSLF